MTKQRWAGITIGIGIFLAAFGVAMAVTVFQVTREVPSTLVSAQVLADENLGLYHDPDATQPVTALEFTRLQPPLRSGVIETIYVRNESAIDLTLIEPCREVFDGDDEQNGIRIGYMDSAISSLDGVELGGFCDRRAILAPDEVVRVELRLVDPDPGLEAGSYSFTTVFGAVGEAAPEPVPPPGGMVGWWPGDGSANDIVGGHHGTLTGDFAQGMVAQGFSLDGTGDFVLVPDSAELNITGDVTVDLWARRTVFGVEQYMITKGGAAVGGIDVPSLYNLFFVANDNLLALFERADGSNLVLTGPAVTDTNFHHYAYVRSGDTHKLFMDGDVVASGNFTGSPGDTSGLPLVIGAIRWDPDPPGFVGHFGGVIDEVEVFDRALSDAEVRAIYDAGSAGKIKPPAVLFVGPGPNGEPSDFDIDGDGDIDSDDQIIIHFNGARTFGDIFRVSLVDGSAPDLAYLIIGDAAARLPLADRDSDGDVDASDVQVVLSGDTAVVSIIRLFDATTGQLQFSADSNIVSGDRFALRWATPRGP